MYIGENEQYFDIKDHNLIDDEISQYLNKQYSEPYDYNLYVEIAMYFKYIPDWLEDPKNKLIVNNGRLKANELQHKYRQISKEVYSEEKERLINEREEIIDKFPEYFQIRFKKIDATHKWATK